MTQTQARHMATLEKEAETWIQQEQDIQELLQARVVRLGRVTREVKVPLPGHGTTTLIVTKRLTIYSPCTGHYKIRARILRGLQLPLATVVWVVDSILYGFTRHPRLGQALTPAEVIDLIRYPGKHFKRRAR